MGRTGCRHPNWDSAWYRRCQPHLLRHNKGEYLGYFFTCASLISFPGVVHVPTVDWYSWWPPIIIILLRWLASRQPVLPGPPSFKSNSPVADTPEFHRTRARAWHANSTNNTRAEFCITSRSSSIANVTCVEPYGLVHIFTSYTSVAISVIKAFVNQQFVKWHTCSMALDRR